MASNKKRGWTRWLWQDNATNGQKWVLSVLLIMLVLAVIPMFYRSFVPSPEWQRLAWYLVAACMAAASWGLVHLYRTGRWSPAGPWVDAGPFKRTGLLLLMLAFMCLIFWMVWAKTLPMAITWLMGEDAQEQVTVEKQRSSGRYNCRHQFKVQEIRSLFFEFCISGDDYASLPSGPMPALLKLQRSYFGKTVQSLALTKSAAQVVEAGAAPADDAEEAAATEPMCVTTVTVGDKTTTTVEPCEGV